MPSIGAEAQRFEIQRVDAMWAETGGRTGSVGLGFPLWKMELDLGVMSQADGDAWRAFVRSLHGAARQFYARDLLRGYPKAYPGGFGGLLRAGGGAFPADGAPTTWSVNGSRDVLTLNGMPANFPIAVGDHAGFVWGGTRRAIAASLESVVGSAGGVAVFTIEPPLPVAVPGDATVKLASADVLMRVVPRDTAIGSEDTVNTRGGRVVAIQDLRA